MSVMNLKDEPVLQEGRVTGPVTGPEAETGLGHSCVLAVERKAVLSVARLHTL